MGSTRLPDKVMMEVVGTPILQLIIERLQHSRNIDEIVVATTTNPKDKAIANLCDNLNVKYFRGDEEDVLGRILSALLYYDADVGVEVFGDCPLIDPAIVDKIISFYIKNQDKYDFVSNDLKTTYPPGVEVEVYNVKILEDASKRNSNRKIREHGTLYIRQHPEIYRLHNIEAPSELFYPNMEIELDTKEDYIVIKKIFEHLYPQKPDFNTYDVVDFLLKHPEIQRINNKIPRRWKKFRRD